MKIREILHETDTPADPKKLAGDQVAALKGALSIPGISINKSNGSAYLNYRFGLAMAGAPDYPTKATGAISGDPLLSTYTDAEIEIINKAAEWVGAGKIVKLSDNRSTELNNTNKVSPMVPRGPIRSKSSNQK